MNLKNISALAGAFMLMSADGNLIVIGIGILLASPVIIENLKWTKSTD